eukprot:5806967-Karenia_brevis.AAC.1
MAWRAPAPQHHPHHHCVFLSLQIPRGPNRFQAPGFPECLFQSERNQGLVASLEKRHWPQGSVCPGVWC